MADTTLTTGGFSAVRQTSSDAIAVPDFAPLQSEMRSTFATNRTRPIEWRLQQLRALEAGVLAHCDAIVDAVNEDLGRPKTEGLLGEVATIIDEIRFTLSNLETWATPESVSHPLIIQPGSSEIIREPKGLVLIIGPWNFPIQLCLIPLIGAIAAGCCAVIKPSEVSPKCARLTEQIVSSHLDQQCYRVVQGEVAVATGLLRVPWDHILYTGSGDIAKVVLRAAAEHLCPVTLELGGKSPAIVNKDANIAVAVRRILHGKFFNTGQICIAPDYVLVHKDVKAALVAAMKERVVEMFGPDPHTSSSLGRIVNSRHWDRIAQLVRSADGSVVVGGLEGVERTADNYFPPTLIEDVSPTNPLMQQEIFGPVLPILGVDDMDEAIAFVNGRDKALALYVFTGDKATANHVVANTSAGGSCINDVVFHNANPNLKFGGVGPSGMGGYHGKYSFEEFSHQRSVMTRDNWLDLSVRYPPYDDAALPLLKKISIGPLVPEVVKKVGVASLAVVAGLFLKSRL
jgi:aldehyde dehydrogenase (NAD+)